MLKITLKKDQYLWFTSDSHYGHANLCSSTTKWRDQNGKIPPDVRNFDTLDKMNSTIVDNINKFVQSDDILINAGDWSFGGFENIKTFRDRIVCQNIHLICGNHDEKIIENKNNIQSIFTQVYVDHYLELEVNDGNDKYNFVICHFPITSWNRMSKGVPQLHGHVHLPPNKRLGPGKSLDIGVDGNNMFPLSLREVNNILSKQPIKPLCLPSDHHVNERNKQ